MDRNYLMNEIKRLKNYLFRLVFCRTLLFLDLFGFMFLVAVSSGMGLFNIRWNININAVFIVFLIIAVICSILGEVGGRRSKPTKLKPIKTKIKELESCLENI